MYNSGAQVTGGLKANLCAACLRPRNTFAGFHRHTMHRVSEGDAHVRISVLHAKRIVTYVHIGTKKILLSADNSLRQAF